ncbi:hypothetical protein BDR26DRAFT_172536 [Obelidium mucronatum]|nr:hypothetical protein BDR26DRAFT_172536 [Obelidium mucronatum]
MNSTTTSLKHRLTTDPNFYSTSAFNLSHNHHHHYDRISSKRMSVDSSISSVVAVTNQVHTIESLERKSYSLMENNKSFHAIETPRIQIEAPSPPASSSSRSKRGGDVPAGSTRTTTTATTVLVPTAPPSPIEPSPSSSRSQTPLARKLKFNSIQEMAARPGEVESRGIESFDGFTQAGGLLNGGVTAKSIQDYTTRFTFSRRGSAATNESGSSSNVGSKLLSAFSSIRRGSSARAVGGGDGGSARSRSGSSSDGSSGMELGATAKGVVAKPVRPAFWNLAADTTDLNVLRRRRIFRQKTQGDKEGQQPKVSPKPQVRHQDSSDTLFSGSAVEDESSATAAVSQSDYFFSDRKTPSSLPRLSKTSASPVNTPTNSLPRPLASLLPLKGIEGDETSIGLTVAGSTATKSQLRVPLRSVQSSRRSITGVGSNLRRRSRSSGRHSAYSEAAAAMEAAAANASNSVSIQSSSAGWVGFMAGTKFTVAMFLMVLFCFMLLTGSLGLLMRVNTVLEQLENISV